MEYLKMSISLRVKNQYLVHKLSFLHTILEETKNGYQNLGQFVIDMHVRKAVNILAVESAQFAEEIRSQILSLGGQFITEQRTSHLWEDVGYINIQDSCEVLKACNRSEAIVIRAYKELLNDPAIDKGVLSVLNYQMNTFLGTFLNMRLLSSCIRH